MQGRSTKWSDLSPGHRHEILENTKMAGSGLTKEQNQELEEHEYRIQSELDAEEKAQNSLREKMSKEMLSGDMRTISSSEYWTLFKKSFAELLRKGTNQYFMTDEGQVQDSRLYLEGRGRDPALAGSWIKLSAGLSSSHQPMSPPQCPMEAVREASQTGHACVELGERRHSRQTDQAYGEELSDLAQRESPSSQQTSVYKAPAHKPLQETSRRLSIKFVGKREPRRLKRALYASSSTSESDSEDSRERTTKSADAYPSLHAPEKERVILRKRSPSLDLPPFRASKRPDHDPSTVDVEKSYCISSGHGAKIPRTSSGRTTPSDEVIEANGKAGSVSGSHADALERLRIGSLKYRSRNNSDNAEQGPTSGTIQGPSGPQVTYDTARKAINPNAVTRRVSDSRGRREDIKGPVPSVKRPRGRPQPGTGRKQPPMTELLASNTEDKAHGNLDNPSARSNKRRRPSMEEEAHGLLMQFGAKYIQEPSLMSRDKITESCENKPSFKASAAELVVDSSGLVRENRTKAASESSDPGRQMSMISVAMKAGSMLEGGMSGKDTTAKGSREDPISLDTIPEDPIHSSAALPAVKADTKRPRMQNMTIPHRSKSTSSAQIPRCPARRLDDQDQPSNVAAASVRPGMVQSRKIHRNELR